MPEPIYAYPLDQTGSLLSNLITDEVHTLYPVGAIEHHFIIPDFAPFYKTGFVLYHPASGHALVEGIDYLFTHYFKDATISTGKIVYGSVTLMNKNFGGVVQLTYQTVGGRWTLSEEDLNEYLNNKLLNPRTTTWEILTSVPEIFPPTDHTHENDEEVIGLDLVVEVLEDIEDAIRANAPPLTEGETFTYPGLTLAEIDDIVDPNVVIGDNLKTIVYKLQEQIDTLEIPDPAIDPSDIIYEGLSPGEIAAIVNPQIVPGDDLNEALYKLQEQINESNSGVAGDTVPDPSYLITVATTELLNAAYLNGSAGVGATLTNNSLQIPLTIDNYLVSINDTVLVKNQNDEKQNGVYKVITVGAPGINWVLERTEDYDNSTFGMFRTDNFLFVNYGSYNAQTLWVLSSIGTGINKTILIGTDDVTYKHFGKNNELGIQSKSRFPGSVSIANGRFSTDGDNQEVKYILKRQTTGPNYAELFLDGNEALSRLTIPDDSTWTFDIKITGHQINGTYGHGSFTVSGTIFRVAGNNSTSLQGATVKHIWSRSNATWDVNVQADSINGSLKIEVKGENGMTIRWMAVVTAYEVTN